MHDIKKLEAWKTIKISNQTMSKRYPNLPSWSMMERLASKI
jgi:hypothetical protein